MKAEKWAGAIEAYSRGLKEEPQLGLHYIANLERARYQYQKQQKTISSQESTGMPVVVVGAEMSHNAAGRAYTLAKLYEAMGKTSVIVGCLFWDQQVWEPIRKAEVTIHTIMVKNETRFFDQAWEMVLQHPAKLVHLSKPRMPAVAIGLLYKLLWGSAVLLDIDDEELYFVGEDQPITLDGMKRLCHGLPEPRDLLGPLWTRLAVSLGQSFDGITVANKPLENRYGGTIIAHARDPRILEPVGTRAKLTARDAFNIHANAKVVLFFGTPRRHKGLLRLGQAVSKLPETLRPLLVVAGTFSPSETDLKRELTALLPANRLKLLENQPIHKARDLLATADLVALLNEGDVAEFQSPAKLSDALAMGLPVIVTETSPLKESIAQGWVIEAKLTHFTEQLHELLRNPIELIKQGEKARRGFEQALSIPLVAKKLEYANELALLNPKPVDGKQLNALESLEPRISSPLIAYRYQQWNKEYINWRRLKTSERDEGLVSIIVPVYGNPKELDACLTAVCGANTSWRWELIAVMNDDNTDSREVLKQQQDEDKRIQAIWPGENVQFALGCNLGFAASQGSWVVFLNNDCRVSDGWLEALIEPMQKDQTLAAVQPLLLKPDKRVDCMGVVFDGAGKFGKPLHAGLNHTSACIQTKVKLKAVSGACLATRAHDFAAVEGFNASYINSQEDIDLCIRLCGLEGRAHCTAVPRPAVMHGLSKAPGRFKHTSWSRRQFEINHQD